ncbi:MAG: hypothetical protein HYY84_20280 [Deltaproteobacteria bacterium]|nr:hypothetical protein [Deltaproteobacteria bacterium]
MGWKVPLGVAHPLAVVVPCLFTTQALAFSQRSPITPIGHEWLTVQAAKNVAREPEFQVLNPPKNEVTKSTAECASASCQYDTNSHKVWSAVMGQRWVDIMGFSVLLQGICFDAVAQLNADVQLDHFLVERDTTTPEKRRDALRRANARLRAYFISAAGATDKILWFADGGAATTHHKAIFSYFAFGRAVHLFQDAFSLEHADRRPSNVAQDSYRTVYDIKSYVCTPGAGWHQHVVAGGPPSVMGIREDRYGAHGDVIWLTPTAAKTEANLKPHAVVALRATEDLWRAFMRAHTARADPGREIDRVILQWMQPAPGGFSDVQHNKTQADGCAASVPSEVVIERQRAQCLNLTGRAGPGAKIPPFSWFRHGQFPAVF